MTQEQLEGCVLIAIFMGAEVTQAYSKTDTSDGLLFYYPKDTSPSLYRNNSSEAIKYHTSFDWLIPACKKWDELPLIDNKGYVKLCDYLDLYATWYDVKPLFNQLVKCLKWYNEHEK
jgi:hypothetical protein